eukprot:933439_1
MRRIMRNVTIFLLLLSVHVSASTKKPDDRQSVYQRYAGQYILGGVPDDITALSSKFVGQYDKIPVCGICNSIATTTSTMNPYKCMRKNRDHVVHGACFKNLYENQSDVNSLQCPKCKAGLKYKFKKSNWWSKNWQKLDSQGRKIYEGEMRDFQYHGKGKLFDPFDPLNQSWFEGKFSNGVRNGKGKEYWDDDHKLWFKGNYKDGKRTDMGHTIIMDARRCGTKGTTRRGNVMEAEHCIIFVQTANRCNTTVNGRMADTTVMGSCTEKMAQRST